MDHKVIKIYDWCSVGGMGTGGVETWCSAIRATHFCRYMLGLSLYLLGTKRKCLRVYADFGKYCRCQHDVNCPHCVAYYTVFVYFRLRCYLQIRDIWEYQLLLATGN